MNISFKLNCQILSECNGVVTIAFFMDGSLFDVMVIDYSTESMRDRLKGLFEQRKGDEQNEYSS